MSEPLQVYCTRGPLDGQTFMVERSIIESSLSWWIVVGEGESQRMVLYQQERRYRLGGKCVIEHVPTDGAPVISVQTGNDGESWMRPHRSCRQTTVIRIPEGE